MDKKFNENDIYEIYNKYVKKDIEYFKKNEYIDDTKKLFLEKYFDSPSMKWFKKDYPRVWCLLDFREWCIKYNLDIKNLGYTCDIDPELKILKYEKSQLINYNGHGDGDLHQMNIEEKFDFFIFNQTLEHLYNPNLCVRNIYNSLNSGGYVFTSVPTINIPHMTPFHFGGLTPMGLAMLFKMNNFEILEMGQWGNLKYISNIFEKQDWVGFDVLNVDSIVSNEELNVAQCWILAKKNI